MEIKLDGVRISIVLDEDFYGEKFWKRIEAGTYEPDTLQFIRLNCTTDTLFIDIGAANGAMTLLAARYGSKVIAYEPNPLMFLILNRNLLSNPELNQKVTSYQRAISDVKREIEFSVESNSKILSSIVFSQDLSSQGKIKVDSLSEILTKLSTENLKIIIKMDIEGAEWQILKNVETLQSLKLHKAKLLLALHPGFYRPHRSKIPIIARISFEFFRFRNLLDSIELYRNLSRFAHICRTNLVPVNSKFKFMMLVAAGYHEFIVDFAELEVE